MRIATKCRGGIGNPDRVEEFHLSIAQQLPLEPQVTLEGLGKLITDAKAGIEGRRRVLCNVGDAPPPD